MIKIIFIVMLMLSGHVYSRQEAVVDTRAEKIYKTFRELNKDTMHLVAEFYHPDIQFVDPIGELRGVDKMRSYYENMYKNVKSIRWEFKGLIKQNSEYVLFWRMHLAAPVLNGGEEYWVEGNSHIRFDDATDKVIYHRDYFDMGAFIYEKIPVLKLIIKPIRESFAKH